jgi:MFS family permease
MLSKLPRLTGVVVLSVSSMPQFHLPSDLGKKSTHRNYTGFYNCGWFGGSIPAAAITYGTNNISNNYQWRIPFILQCFACVLVIFFVWFIPESPRWLLAQGREEEALAFLVKYHGNGDPNARLVRLEIEEMKEGIRIDGIDKRWWDCKFYLNFRLFPK